MMDRVSMCLLAAALGLGCATEETTRTPPRYRSGAGAGAGGGGVAKGPEIKLSTGATPLVDAFVTEEGILVVTADSVALVDRAGEELARVDRPREVTAAAFDGEVLVIADGAGFTSYDPALTKIAEGSLTQACASAVLVSGHRFVCGPQNDWQRVFFTYDARTGELLASSSQYTYHGIPMRRVPGTDDFVTVSVGSSPSDFHLYSVLDTGEAQFVNESPYHGDFAATRVYAFNGSPPTHLVTVEGLLLRIYGARCSAEEDSFTSECFTRDGGLGTLSENEHFLGLDSDAAGKLYGLVHHASSGAWDDSCEEGCVVQRIDVASRKVEAEKSHVLDNGAVVLVRHDSVSNRLLVGYHLSGKYSEQDDGYPGFVVSLLSYE